MPEKDPAIITLKGVRLSFPHLFQAHAMEGSEPKFSASFILDNVRDAATLDKIESTIERLALDHWKKKINFKTCLKDGNEKADKDGYGDGVSFVPASRKTRPAVVNADLSPIAEEDGVIYAGCYVNATIRLWVQDNKWGKRVNAELRAVMFARDGESFGAGKVDIENEFEEVEKEAAGGFKSSRSPRSTRSGGTNLDDY